MKLLVLALCLPLIACSQSRGVGNDTGLFGSDNSTAMTPGARAVQIGEGGPTFNACATVGRVVNLSPGGETYLPVRAAPFVEADELVQLSNDARIYVCTRSIDQRWQGVVVPPPTHPTPIAASSHRWRARAITPGRAKAAGCRALLSG